MGTTTTKTPSWRLPIALLGLLTVGAYGLFLYAFGAFITPIREDTGWSNALVSGAFSVSALLGGAGALLAGNLLDRVGARPVLLGSLVVSCASLWWAASASSPWEFLIAWGIGGGVASAGLYYNTTMAITTRLVPAKERPSAFAMLTLLGGFAAPVAFSLSGWLVEAYGWRDAMRSMVGFLAICALPAVLFVHKGTASDHQHDVESDDDETGFVTVREALATPIVRRWLLAVGASMMSLVAVQVHHVAAIAATGVALGTATTIATVRGLLSLPGRGMVGPLVNRLGLVSALRLTYVFMGVGTTALLFAGPLSTVWIFAIITGVAFGSVAPLQGLYAAELFGHRRIGKMMGMQQVVMSLAAAAGPFLLGLAEDQTGGYTFPLIIAVSLNVVALLVFRPPARLANRQTSSAA